MEAGEEKIDFNTPKVEKNPDLAENVEKKAFTIKKVKITEIPEVIKTRNKFLKESQSHGKFEEPLRKTISRKQLAPLSKQLTGFQTNKITEEDVFMNNQKATVFKNSSSQK